MHKPPPPRPALPSSSITAFIDEDRIRALLQPFLPEVEERDYILRCLLQSGPAHHRGANYVLLALLGRLVGTSGEDQTPDRMQLPVPMRLPPHVHLPQEEAHYPLRLSASALSHLAGEDPQRLDAMIDCLTDGPPQHALANVLMVNLLTLLIERLGTQR